MTTPTTATSQLRSAWEVLVLFLIPVGGGIPAGVILARSRGLGWPIMTVLYFISDIVLACIFEPLMLLFISAGRRSPFLARVGAAMKQSTQKTISQYGTSLGPLSLILVAFGVDPMTGRTAAVAAGHGFVSGWTLAITGDMLYFAVIMVATLCLNKAIGDGTWATVIMVVAMMVVPVWVRKFRDWRRAGGTIPNG